MLYNIISAVGRVLTHVKFEGRWNLGERAHADFDQAHVLSDKLSKLTGRDLPQPLEARDLGISQIGNSLIAFFLAITIARLTAIPHAKNWRLQNIDMTRSDEFFEVIEEKSHQQIADVESHRNRHP